jgi:formylglycine-generating enzyme required for sulfatase activity
LPDEPLLGFIEIPAGPFLMGSDKAHDPSAYQDELPQHEGTLPRYWISRYPVTVAQFRAFVEGAGTRPQYPESLQGVANHPVVSVSWYEAVNYCDWLTACLRAWSGMPEPLATLLRDARWQVGLPSEAEWEKAARGTEGLIYPWGNEPDPNRANYHNTGLSTTSTVGCFPDGLSPYGIEDLSGNVWEWTRSLWGNYPYPANQREQVRREDFKAGQGSPRVLRGGAVYDVLRYVRCACRGRGYPKLRHGYFPYHLNWLIGFRVVVSPTS